MPKRYTMLSKRRSHNWRRISPVMPDFALAALNMLENCFSKMP